MPSPIFELTHRWHNVCDEFSPKRHMDKIWWCLFGELKRTITGKKKYHAGDPKNDVQQRMADNIKGNNNSSFKYVRRRKPAREEIGPLDSGGVGGEGRSKGTGRLTRN